MSINIALYRRLFNYLVTSRYLSRYFLVVSLKIFWLFNMVQLSMRKIILLDYLIICICSLCFCVIRLISTKSNSFVIIHSNIHSISMLYAYILSGFCGASSCLFIQRSKLFNLQIFSSDVMLYTINVDNRFIFVQRYTH